jgi:hypothetical protein
MFHPPLQEPPIVKAEKIFIEKRKPPKKEDKKKKESIFA